MRISESKDDESPTMQPVKHGLLASDTEKSAVMQMFELFKPMEDRVDDLIIQNVLGENYEDIKPWEIDSKKVPDGLRKYIKLK